MPEKLSNAEKAEVLAVFLEALREHRRERLERVARGINLACYWVMGLSLLLIALTGIFWWLKNGVNL